MLDRLLSILTLSSTVLVLALATLLNRSSVVALLLVLSFKDPLYRRIILKVIPLYDI